MHDRDRRLSADTISRLVVDTEPWLSCDDCFRHLDEYVEMLVAARAAVMPAMDAHLRGCPACAEEAATVLLLAAEDSGVDPAPILARFGL
jgi:hypothetical protein